MYKGVGFLVLSFLLPVVAYAASFAQQSIFLSKDSVTEGDTVLVHVVISNPSTSAFSGMLTIADEASTIGTVAVSLGAGAADTFSTSWKPVAGTHKITATLTSGGAVTATEQETFSIAAKPVQTKSTGSFASFPTVESSAPVEQKLADISPSVASSAIPAFNSIDNARLTAAQKLFEGVTWSRQELDKASGNSATSSQSTGLIDRVTHTLWIVCITAALYAFTVLRSVVTSIALFYPVIAFLILYLLWKGYRTVRRPDY